MRLGTTSAVLAKAVVANRKRKRLKLIALVTMAPLPSGIQTFEGNSHGQMPHLPKIACLSGRQEFTIWKANAVLAEVNPNHIELSTQTGRTFATSEVERPDQWDFDRTEPTKLNALSRVSKSFPAVSSAEVAEVRRTALPLPLRRGSTNFRRRAWQPLQPPTAEVNVFNLSNSWGKLPPKAS
ncbi:MAG: hypothetical protein ACTS5A_02410 [Candidatus Hodgkinia cicadicola]